MTVTNRMHKGIVIAFAILCMIGVLLLLRIGFVLGMSAYMNTEATSKDGNLAVVSAYYNFQAATGDFMEPYIAYYNAGTALAKANQPDQAEKLLKTALDKVDNQQNECFVRNNLAKVQEQLGDYYTVSDMPSTAQNYYSEAVKTISDAPATCFPPPPPNGGSTGQQDPKGNPVTPQGTPPSENAQNGQNMKKTEQESKDKQNQAEQAQGQNTADGQNQIKQEMNQAQSNTANQQDVTKQQQGSTSGTGNGNNGQNNSQQQPPSKPW